MSGYPPFTVSPAQFNDAVIGELIDIDDDLESSIPTFWFALPVFEYVAPANGLYAVQVNLVISMSNTNRSWIGEYQINGAPQKPFISMELKDQSNREPVAMAKRFTLNQGDVLSVQLWPRVVWINRNCSRWQ